jgi:hypothetical protein
MSAPGNEFDEDASFTGSPQTESECPSPLELLDFLGVRSHDEQRIEAFPMMLSNEPLFTDLFY